LETNSHTHRTSQTTPLVTIGVPFFNAANYLEDSIRSVLNQSFSDWELILIDDGSTDNSLAIAKSFVDPRIVIYSDGINKGLVSRLNELATLAKGELIARMDADDIMHCDRIAKQVEYLQSHPEVDVLGTPYAVINENNQILGVSNTSQVTSPDNAIFSGEFIAHPTVIARKDWFIEHPYNAKYIRAEDKELWIRVRKHAVFRNLNEPLYFYRVEAGEFYKYYTTNKSVIKLLSFGIFTHEIPIHTAFYQVFYFLLKTLTYSVLSLFNLSSILVKKRYKPLDEKTLTYLYHELNKAKE
jgi:glycosyltransferase involved in cell wall biosynthesis